eukprot:CAMPEP_0175127690 /NCGR_PEP_ID=MMETSP0087-20121206/4521_1 /TAXON_ID=136419 /ORGANISM="Unknown Unknown, Strain D1" /LENGTH=510 /DNA_ID=CAMNT_0016409685 /DNA_START=139 /DNA_END=1669 /DNA_ORIENTATION=+
MASRLCRSGIKNVVVLEKEANIGHFGKSHSHKLEETGDIPHEMGTCYLSWSYKHVKELLKEYVGDDVLIQPGGGNKDQYGALHLPSPQFDKETGKNTITSDQWLYAYREKIALPDWLGAVTPDKVQALGFVVDVMQYRQLHESLMGKYDYHGIPPKPTPERLAKMNKTFGELLRENGMEALLDLCCVGFGSYGLGYDVPALYGLWFVTPEAVEAYVHSKLNKDVKTVQLVRTGFSSLWKSMVEKDKISVRYGVDIKSIDRSLSDPCRPITVKASIEGKEETVEGDFLVFAAPTKLFPHLVNDATDFEKQIVDGLTSVGLHVNLFRTAKKPLIKNGSERVEESSLTFYPESLQPKYTPAPNGQVYAERNSVRAYAWDSDAEYKDRYVVTYQYFPKPIPEEESEATTRKAVEFITNETMTITATPSEPAPECLYTKNWDYFPHFTQDAVNKMLPWLVFERQGENRTWVIGSSVCFESVEDVTKYNSMLLASVAFSAQTKGVPLEVLDISITV